GVDREDAGRGGAWRSGAAAPRAPPGERDGWLAAPVAAPACISRHPRGHGGMSTAKATRHVLERLASSEAVLLAILLELPAVPAWCDGRDADGRAVFLVGRTQLGTSPEAEDAVAGVLEALRVNGNPNLPTRGN